jgi:hypothetical protein
VDAGYLEYLRLAGYDLDETHEALLPLDELDLGADTVLCRLTPYRSAVTAGQRIVLTATVRNPHRVAARAVLRPVVPAGWTSDEDAVSVDLDPGEEVRVPLALTAGPDAHPRSRVAVDVTIGGLRLGQHAEAIVAVA